MNASLFDLVGHSVCVFQFGSSRFCSFLFCLGEKAQRHNDTTSLQATHKLSICCVDVVFWGFFS